jgi:hypothetical protein
MFVTSWPGHREGFNGLTLVNPRTSEILPVHLRETAELLGICGKTGRFYTEHYYGDGSVLGHDEYDSNGMFIAESMTPLGVHSANCRNVHPLDALHPHGYRPKPVSRQWGFIPTRLMTANELRFSG